MKRGIGIGTIIFIGLVVWWLTQSKQARAAELLPRQTYPSEVGETESEKLHKVVPITEYIERQIPVYQTIEEWEAVNG